MFWGKDWVIMKKIQIGIMGSAADLNYSDEAEKFAKELAEYLQSRHGEY